MHAPIALKPGYRGIAQQSSTPTLVPESRPVNIGHTLVLYASAALLLINFATLTEFLYMLTGMSTYLLYVIGPVAIVGAVLSGGIARTFRARAPYYFMAFSVCMLLATLASTWRGGSVARLWDYTRFVLPILIVAGGVAIDWKHIRLFFFTIAIAAVLTLVMARMFGDTSSGRLNLGGSIGNSNDLATHLIVVLPFVFFVGIDPTIKLVLRIFSFAVIGYGVWVILGTGSRGGLIALLCVIAFLLLRASMKQRIAFIVGLAVASVILVGALPPATLQRLGSLFGEQHEEAKESKASRSYLFHKSVEITFQHPWLGVGTDQFSNFEGGESVKLGQYGNWHATHCAYTQVSSENGIPALIFFVSALGSTILLVHRTYRAARARGYPDIIRACMCYELAMLGLLVSVTFLSDAYRYYFPAMIGLAVSMSFAAEQSMRTKLTAAPVANKMQMPRSVPVAAV
jgi:hypothetical protein